MGVLINPFDPPEGPRKKERSVRLGNSSRGYFSERTVRRARVYRDIPWVRLVSQAAIATCLVLLGFAIGPGFLGPVLGLAGAALALITLYVILAKAYGTTQRR